MSGLGFSREASIRESYRVNRDLTLRSFEVSQTIDGSPMKVSGEVVPKGVRVVIESAGNRKEKTLARKGEVYPSAVINLYPMLKGISAGKKYSLSMLDTESVAIKTVTYTAVGIETLEGKKTVHLRNDIYPLVANDIWLDLSGVTLKESVRDGWIETRAEDEKVAARFLAEAAVSRRDMLLDFSLVPVDRPIERAAALRLMSLELVGFPDTIPLLVGPLQKSERTGGNTAAFTIDLSPLSASGTTPTEEIKDRERYLTATDRIQADNPAIARQQKEILGEVKEPRAVVEKLVRWVADSIKDTGADNRSPVETLEKRSGNCQSHARLYASLARSAGVPTRLVSGLAYAEGKGFLYLCWAESYIGFWLPVDPTFGEVPANATHIKLVEGDSPDDLAPLAGVIGVIKAKVLRTEY
jgi:transglutaminase-like putative cysteine protease